MADPAGINTRAPMSYNLSHEASIVEVRRFAVELVVASFLFNADRAKCLCSRPAVGREDVNEGCKDV